MNAIQPADTLARQLALVIDLNVCVGCHACGCSPPSNCSMRVT